MTGAILISDDLVHTFFSPLPEHLWAGCIAHMTVKNTNAGWWMIERMLLSQPKSFIGHKIQFGQLPESLQLPYSLRGRPSNMCTSLQYMLLAVGAGQWTLGKGKEANSSQNAELFIINVCSDLISVKYQFLLVGGRDRECLASGIIKYMLDKSFPDEDPALLCIVVHCYICR